MKKKIWRTSSSCLKPQMFGPMLVIGSVGRFDCWFSYSRDFGSFSILFLDPCLRKKCKEYLQYIKLKFHILGLSLNMFFFLNFSVLKHSMLGTQLWPHQCRCHDTSSQCWRGSAIHAMLIHGYSDIQASFYRTVALLRALGGIICISLWKWCKLYTPQTEADDTGGRGHCSFGHKIETSRINEEIDGCRIL